MYANFDLHNIMIDGCIKVPLGQFHISGAKDNVEEGRLKQREDGLTCTVFASSEFMISSI